MNGYCNPGPPVTATLADCIPILRLLLNDINPIGQEFADATLTMGVASALKIGELPGYSVAPDGNTIQPAFPDPTHFGLLNFKVTRLFILGAPDRYEFRSRAFTERIGSYRDMKMQLDQKIHEIENGAMFEGWQMFYGFLSGISGLSLLEVFTSMKVNSPFYSITLTATGGTAAS